MAMTNAATSARLVTPAHGRRAVARSVSSARTE